MASNNNLAPRIGIINLNARMISTVMWCHYSVTESAAENRFEKLGIRDTRVFWVDKPQDRINSINRRNFHASPWARNLVLEVCWWETCDKWVSENNARKKKDAPSNSEWVTLRCWFPIVLKTSSAFKVGAATKSLEDVVRAFLGDLMAEIDSARGSSFGRRLRTFRFSPGFLSLGSNRSRGVHSLQSKVSEWFSNISVKFTVRISAWVTINCIRSYVSSPKYLHAASGHARHQWSGWVFGLNIETSFSTLSRSTHIHVGRSQ